MADFSPYSGIGGKPWWEDEKKKKAPIGIGGKLITSVKPKEKFSEPAAKPTSVTQKQKATPVAQLPRNYFEAEAQRATTAMRQSKDNSSLTDYYKMARVYGSTKEANDRIRRVATLWNVFMPDVDGKDAIFELAKSPYPTETIEAMLSQGRRNVLGPTKDGKPSLVSSAAVAKKGLDPENENDVLKVSLSQRLFGTSPIGGPVRNLGASMGTGVAGGIGGRLALESFEPGVTNAEWFLSDGWKDTSFLDKPSTKQMAIARGLVGVDITKSKTWGNLRSHVQERVLFLLDPRNATTPPDEIPEGLSDLTTAETRAVEAAHGVWRLRYRLANEKAWDQHSRAVMADSVMATAAFSGVAAPLLGGGAKLLFSGPVARQAAARVGYFLGFSGAIAPYAMAEEEAARTKLMETGAAQALTDPLHLTATTTKSRLGNIAGPEIDVRVTYADKAKALQSYVYSLSEMGTEDSEDLVKQAQRNLQYPVYGADGELISPGFGRDLQISGKWDSDWDQALYDYFEWQGQANVSDQMLLIQEHVLDATHPLDGNMDDPEVIAAMARYSVKWAEQEADALNPTFTKQIARAAGMPLTKNQLAMFYNEMANQGIAQGIFKTPIKIAEMVGGAAEGMLGVLNYSARAQADNALQKLTEDAIAYAESKGVADKGIIHAAPWMLDRLFTDGPLKDDAAAQEKWAPVKQRRAQLVKEHWHGDVRGTLALSLGMDPAKVDEMTLNDPEGVHIYNLLFLGALTVSGSKFNFFQRGKAVAPDPISFKADPKAWVDTQRITRLIKAKQPGGAAHLIMGKDGRALAAELDFTYRGVTAPETMGGGVSGGLQRLGREIRTALQNGEVDAVANRTKLPPEVAAELTQSIGRKIMDKPSLSKASKQTGKAADNIALSQDEAVVKILGERQASHHDVIDIDEYVMDASANAYSGMTQVVRDEAGEVVSWADATDGVKGRQVASVFPHYRAKGMSDPSYTKVRLEQIAAETQDPLVAWMFRKTWKFFEKAPSDKVLINNQKSADWMFSNALAASRGNFKFATDIRNAWTRARTMPEYERLAEAVNVQANAHYKLDMSTGGRQTALNVNPLSGSLESEGTLLATTRQQYTVQFPGLRSTMHEAYIPDSVWDSVLYNPGRYVRRTLTRKVTTPARRITVGYGPQLAAKHTAVDMMFRLPLEAGLSSLVRFRKYSKRWEDVMGEVDPRTARDVQLSEHVYHMSEQQYNVDKEATTNVSYVPKRIYEIDPKTGELAPVNLKQGINDLRRWATDDIFISYQKGADGIREYLYTPKGREFLESSRNLKYTRENIGEALNLEGDALYEAAVEDFVTRVVGQEFEPLRAAAPRIYEGLSAIARGERALTDKNLENVVREANLSGVMENPYLSLHSEAPKMWYERFSPANTVKYLMWSNKQARTMFYKSTVIDAYDDLVKVGVDKDSALRAAADVAELKTTRAMFDLSDATYAEAQNRWFAYFATKHRLYGTWLGKMAVERPWIAAAAGEVINWMEARNADENLAEWEKGKFVLDTPWLPWKQIRMNMATIFWLADYPLESTFGKLPEYVGSQAVNLIPGVNTRINWGDFGPSLIRFDRLIMTTAIALPLLNAWAHGELTNDYVKKYLDEMPTSTLGSPELQKQWQKAINMQLMLMRMNGEEMGEDATAVATQRALLSALGYELYNSAKPLPLIFYDENDLKYKDTQKAYFNMTPEDRSDFINDPANEWFSWGLGMGTTNPATRQNVELGWQKFSDNRAAWSSALYDALDDGSIMISDTFNSIMNYYEQVQTALLDPNAVDPNGEKIYNADFAETFAKGGYSSFDRESALSTLIPLIDPKTISEAGRVPDDLEGQEYKKQLQKQFEDYCKTADMLPNDLNDPHVFWLKQQMVEEPYQKFMKMDPNRYMTYRQQTAADVLAQGEPGPNASAKYTTMVHNHVATKMLGRGIQWNSKTGVNSNEPVFALMTTQEKKMIGWNSTPGAEERWRLWSFRKAAADAYLRDQGIVGATNKVAVRVREALKAYGDELAAGDVAFKKEWEFSQLSLEERMTELGVGSGDDEAAKGWFAFLGLVRDYRAALGQVPNGKKFGVGPTAKSAKETAQAYLQRLTDMKLKEKYPAWWVQFDGLFPLTSFGFNPDYRLESGADKDYWWATKDTDLPTEEELTGIVEE